jgi:Protein of unknwon function (DUF3310)
MPADDIPSDAVRQQSKAEYDPTKECPSCGGYLRVGHMPCESCGWRERSYAADNLKRLQNTGELPIIAAAETVDHPTHYHPGTYEAINVIEAWDLGFCLGNTVKYISRAGRKGDRIEDLKKARWYLDREIENACKQP